MHLTIPIETAPAILYTSIHATHYRTTGLPVLEFYEDNTRHQTTVLYVHVNPRDTLQDCRATRIRILRG
jgi:hypothetical protein